MSVQFYLSVSRYINIPNRNVSRQHAHAAPFVRVHYKLRYT